MPVDRTTLMQDPHTVYQDWLDVTSSALMLGDIEGFVAKMAIPFIMRTSASETVLETMDDLRGDARNVAQALKSQQVTHYIRLVKKAHYLDEDTIEGWHTTYVLRNAASVTPTYSNRMIMKRIDGAWKVTEADHELSGSRFPLTLLRSNPGSFETTWACAKDRISATQARAEPIYQAFLDSLSTVLNAGDFDGWCDHYTYPHDIHYDATDHTVQEPGEIRSFFDLLTERIQDLNADRLVRYARYAEFLADDRIFGYHDAYILKADEPVFGPVKSRMKLTNEEGRWKCSSITNSLSTKSAEPTEITVSSKLPTMREIQERMRK